MKSRLFSCFRAIPITKKKKVTNRIWEQRNDAQNLCESRYIGLTSLKKFEVNFAQYVKYDILKRRLL